MSRPPALRAFACVALMGTAYLSGCASTGGGHIAGVPAEALLARAQAREMEAIRAQSAQTQVEAWLHCATLAHDAMMADQAATKTAAGLLATQCSRAFFDLAAQGAPVQVKAGRLLLGGITVRVEFRGMPDSLARSIYLELADQVSMDPLDGTRHHQAGFGVTMVAFSLPCSDRPICRRYTPEGVFRPATLWLEAPS